MSMLLKIMFLNKHKMFMSLFQKKYEIEERENIDVQTTVETFNVKNINSFYIFKLDL